MKKRKHRRHPPGQGGARFKLLAVAAVVIAILLLADARLHPMVESLAAYQARVFSARIVNQAMIKELESSGVTYDELVHITWNDSGMVTSIQTDVVKVNRLKSHMAGSVVQELMSMDETSVYLPLGTLLGNEWLSGRGPRVEVRMIPTGFVQTEFYNEFTSAGINQTSHQIMMSVTVQMKVLIPGYNILVDSSTNFSIAETVIVGSIPDTYVQFAGDASPFISHFEAK